MLNSMGITTCNVQFGEQHEGHELHQQQTNGCAFLLPSSMRALHIFFLARNPLLSLLSLLYLVVIQKQLSSIFDSLNHRWPVAKERDSERKKRISCSLILIYNTLYMSFIMYGLLKVQVTQYAMIWHVHTWSLLFSVTYNYIACNYLWII